MVSTPHWTPALGVLYSAYGSGAKPKIINTAATSCDAFTIGGVGMMHLTLQDLEFNLENASVKDPLRPLVENRATFMSSSAYPINMTLNRVDVNKFNQGILVANPHGEFIKDSTFTDSQVTHMYHDAALDVALLNNKFDYAGNHLLYTNMSNGLIVGNKFSRQAFGRTQFRIFGTDPASFATKSVWLSDNTFEGWIDPRTSAHCAEVGITGGCPWESGKRYNFSLVEFTPNNSSAIKFSDNIVFTRNTLKNAENMLRISASAHVVASNNIFDSMDSSPTPRLQLHYVDFARRPLNDIAIKDNLFTERSTARPANSPIMHLTNYGTTWSCDDLPTHKDIIVSNNQAITASPACFMSNYSFGGTPSCLLASTQSGTSGTLGSAIGLTLSSNKIVFSSTTSTMDQAITTAKQTTVTNTTVSNTVNKTTTAVPATTTTTTTKTKAVTTSPTKSVIKIAPLQKK